MQALSARRSIALVLVVPLLVALSAATAFAALGVPKSDLWPHWTKHDAQSQETIDHGDWDRLLNSYVTAAPDGVNRFDYRNVSDMDRKTLKGYIGRLAATQISRFSRSEQMAYWINLYNALTVQVILDHYPVESIREINISPGLFAFGPWGKKLVTIEGQEVSLNDIEHRILRPIWQDPRIHYAVNCASIGCPDLQRTAFTGSNLERMLDIAAKSYINHPRGVRLDNGELTVSSIYVWFQVDFGDSDKGVIEHLKQYAKPPLKSALESKTEIDDDDYDWNLNEASKPKS